MRKKIVSLLLVCLAVSLKLIAGITVDVSRFGAKPNSFEDAVQAIQKAIDFCKAKPGAVLSFPKGRYDFWPEHASKRNYFISNTSSEDECPSKVKTIGILIEKMHGLTIEGNGSLFVFHGKMVTWALDHSSDVMIRNISVDFERPSMSEMTFETVSKDSITVAIHPDSRFTIINDTLQWYGEGWGVHHYHAILVDTQKGTERYSSWEPFLNSRAKQTGALSVTFYGNFEKYDFKKGQVLTVRDPIRDQVGAFINHSKNIQLQQVNMYYMHGLGIVAQFSENLHYQQVNVRPRSGSGRTIAAFADAMHFSGCRGQITIDSCNFKGLHDDPVNVHGTHLQVTAMPSSTSVIVRFMHPQTYGFEAFFKGDSVAFVHSASLQQYQLNKVKMAKLVSVKEMLLEFEQPLSTSIKKGDCLENITWTPSLTIRNSRFEGTNTRGLLVTTRRPVLIESNTFYRTGMHAILIGDDAQSWYESGPVQDVIIRNNRFEECGYNTSPDNYVINIAPENHELVKGYMVHRNIRIENNFFRVYDYPLLNARSTSHLIFKNNRIEASSFMEKQAIAKAQFNLNGCTDVDISNNAFDWPGKPLISITNMSAKDLKTDISTQSNDEHP